ncbi:hypothetical protein E2C01_016843 [Portunus trituberculatus]|uniref:Uncharacterized protein n=1 Tax=Portunus trituberculatus TaxID=210409 RepID=A0A5B7DRQ6_PORTR|nr:hypothetical protein [Portunus trituberculatus]
MHLGTTMQTMAQRVSDGGKTKLWLSKMIKDAWNNEVCQPVVQPRWGSEGPYVITLHLAALDPASAPLRLLTSGRTGREEKWGSKFARTVHRQAQANLRHSSLFSPHLITPPETPHHLRMWGGVEDEARMDVVVQEWLGEGHLASGPSPHCS